MRQKKKKQFLLLIFETGESIVYGRIGSALITLLTMSSRILLSLLTLYSVLYLFSSIEVKMFFTDKSLVSGFQLSTVVAFPYSKWSVSVYMVKFPVSVGLAKWYNIPVTWSVFLSMWLSQIPDGVLPGCVQSDDRGHEREILHSIVCVVVYWCSIPWPT